MKHINDTKPVQRIVTTTGQALLVVRLSPEGIYFREKGRRRTFLLPYGVGFQRAVELTVIAERPVRRARPIRRGLLR